MDFITLGSITIETKWLVIPASLLLSLIIIRIRNKKSTQTIILESISNSLLIGLFVIKFSLIIIEPKLVIKDPLSLLYFSGGELGFWLGVSIAIISFFRTTRKKNVPFPDSIDVFFYYTLFSFTIFHLISMFMNPGWEHILNLLFTTFVFAWIFKKENQFLFSLMQLDFPFFKLF